MAQQPIIAREYKLMLRSRCFTGEADTLLRQARAFWRDLQQAIRPLVFATDGAFDRIAKQRLIRFYDTQERRLQQHAYILRERVDVVSGEREVTLKCRHPDRYVAQARNMEAADAERGTRKFEEDIKPPFQSLYSLSTTQKIGGDKHLNRLNNPGRLYPGLPEQLDPYEADVALTVVGGLIARELVFTGAEFQIGTGPKVEAACALIVWYEAQGDDQRPEVVECSFKYGSPDGQYPGAVARRAYDVFQLLQGEALAGWVDPNARTKTAYVYN